MAAPLYVTCLSLVCPVGLTPESAAAAMRAGISAFGELPYLDNDGEPIMGAVVPGVGLEAYGRARLVELLALALDGLKERLPAPFKLETLPLLLCTREPERPALP